MPTHKPTQQLYIQLEHQTSLPNKEHPKLTSLGCQAKMYMSLHVCTEISDSARIRLPPLPPKYDSLFPDFTLYRIKSQLSHPAAVLTKLICNTQDLR